MPIMPYLNRAIPCEFGREADQWGHGLEAVEFLGVLISPSRNTKLQ